MSHLECGSVVWVRLGQAWWPGTVTTMAKCPPEFVQGIRKMPLSIVKFFHENEFQDVHKAEHIYPYDCERKEEFIRKGQYINKNQSHGDVDLLAKFEADVVTAEKLTGGDMNILQTMGEVAGKRRIDYSDLGFGPPKPKKKKEDMIKRGSDIGQAVVYKKVGIRSAGNKLQRVVIEHKVRILEQPRKENMTQDMREASNWYKCYSCGYTCSRLNVIIWHNKAHINKVCNYDTGIKVPGRRKRKQGTPRTSKEMRKKAKDAKGKENLEHAHTNGEVSSPKKDSQDTQQLLKDWDDEDDDGEGDRVKAPGGPGKSRNDSDDGYSDNDDYPPPQPKYERRPMPKAADINSAFDALLAATPMTPSSNQTTNYVNNDSDSDYSDWEKYYARDSGSESEEEEVAQESDIKSLCEEKEGVTGRNADVTSKEENNDVSECKTEEVAETGDEYKPNISTAVTEEEETKQVDVVDHGNSQMALTPEPEEPVKTEEPEESKPDIAEERLTPPLHYFNPNSAKDEQKEVDDEPDMIEEACSDNIQTEVTSETLEESREALDPVEESRMEIDQPYEMSEDQNDSENDCKSAEVEDYYHDDASVEGSSHIADRVDEKVTQKVEPKIVQRIGIEKEEKESLEGEGSDVEDHPSGIHSSQTRLESGSESIAEPMRVSDVTTSSGSGTTYMLVAVDAHGNTVPTVPTPALSEGGSNLVAVEATMEDGTTRTLYIDPSQLGPNVDLNNLMLHIDTSGQEHVIIPSSSSSDSETPSLDHSMSEGQDKNYADPQPKNDAGAVELEHYELPQEKGETS